MKRPQFTTRELLLAVTLVGIGLGCFVAGYRVVKWHDTSAIALAFFGTIAIGAGVLFPIHSKAAGLAIALALLTVVIIFTVSFALRGT